MLYTVDSQELPGKSLKGLQKVKLCPTYHQEVITLVDTMVI